MFLNLTPARLVAKQYLHERYNRDKVTRAYNEGGQTVGRAWIGIR